MTDAGAELLAHHAQAFQHLDVLDVSNNRLSQAGVSMVHGVARRVISLPQDTRDFARVND
jgi:hypothetical protein